jgi:hypothetical protein
MSGKLETKKVSTKPDTENKAPCRVGLLHGKGALLVL